MDKKVKEAIERFEHDIENRKKLLDSFKKLPLNIIQEAFPEGHWYVSWIDQFEFVMPYVQANFQVVKDFMAEQFPDYVKGRDFGTVWDIGGGSAGMFFKYSHDDIGWDFAFRSGEKGSTCVMNKIGEKSVPIFEVVCGQEAAAEFTAQ
jgi:hypothetical protein